MTPSEIRKKKKSDLEVLVGKLKNEEVLLRLNVKVGDVGSISKMRQTKKTIARIMTILNEKGVEDHG